MTKDRHMPNYDSKHDSFDKDGYKKRCHCEKCVKKYDEWCRKNKEHGQTHCRRKCRTICVVECEKPKTVVYKFGYKKEYEGKWQKHHEKKVPKHCGKCQEKKEKCKCNNKDNSFSY